MGQSDRGRSLLGFAVAQLHARRGRAVALGVGVLVAAVCSGVLSSETATSRLRVTATVKHKFRSAYDILVRPRGAQTPFERRHHVVDDGFLSGLFGGITMPQYREIRPLEGEVVDPRVGGAARRRTPGVVAQRWFGPVAVDHPSRLIGSMIDPAPHMSMFTIHMRAGPDAA